MSERANTASHQPTATGPAVVLLRILRFAAYVARDRNATVEGLPARLTYVTKENSRAA